ncbi:MAG: hypothetical protein Q4E39_01185, partial [bacterium]|nr:hypothetical protein [bacterium]
MSNVKLDYKQVINAIELLKNSENILKKKSSIKMIKSNYEYISPKSTSSINVAIQSLNLYLNNVANNITTIQTDLRNISYVLSNWNDEKLSPSTPNSSSGYNNSNRQLTEVNSENAATLTPVLEPV